MTFLHNFFLGCKKELRGAICAMERYSTNIRKLIIDNQPREYFGSDKIAKYYEERALLIASAKDIVVLRRSLPKEYMDYIFSTGVKNIIYLNSESEREECLVDAALREYEQLVRKIRNIAFDSPVCLKAYIPDDKMQLLADTLHIPLLGKQFYQDNYRKSSVIQICKELELNTIDTIIINSAAEFYAASAIDFFNCHARVIIKPDRGIGGQMISELTDCESVDNHVFPSVVQEFLPAQSEGSIQFFNPCHQGGIYLCDTFQKNFAFRGFHYPANSECESELRASAELILSYFYRKYNQDLQSFGIDYIISNGKVYFHDINPRSTGVTYIFSLLRRTYGEQFLGKCEFIYFQTVDKFHVSYKQLRTILGESGIPHISANNSEGYAILYPGMLCKNILNILVVSKEKHAFQYYHRIMEIVG